MAALELLMYNDEFLLDTLGEFILYDGAASYGCCCPTALCCENKLPSTAVLIAKVTAVTGGATACWTVNDEKELLYVDGIWTIGGNSSCWDSPWLGLAVTCDTDSIDLTWDTNAVLGDPTCACPETPEPWVFQSGQCDPFTFVFKTTLIEDILCPCDDGTIEITITIKP